MPFVNKESDVLKRSYHLILFKFSLFTNGMQEKSTCHFSLIISRFNMTEGYSRALKSFKKWLQEYL